MADVWSAGVVLYIMLYGTLPFHSNDIESLEQKVLEGKYELTTCISKNARDLISRILVQDPSSRITIYEIYQHPWMRDIDPSCNFY